MYIKTVLLSMIYNIPLLLNTFLIDDNIEFTFNISSDVKVLFTFFENLEQNHKKIYNFLSSDNEYFSEHKEILQVIFALAKKYQLPVHISFDLKRKQTRIYLGLYSIDSLISQEITLYLIEKNYTTSQTYTFEQDLYKIDCLGFNIGKKMEMKVYELINSRDPGFLLDSVSDHDVKEYGLLKDMKGRKKQFFRFGEPLEYSLFRGTFPKDFFDSLDTTIGDTYSLQRKVKYYCLEGNNKEIYFI